MAAAIQKTRWRIAGEEFGQCSCAWGCPCQFNALPTYGNCEALIGWQVREGYYGSVQLDGVRFARVYYWPGPIHAGNGTRLMILDTATTPEQRQALLDLDSGAQGHPYWEIFAAVCPNALAPVVAPIELEIDLDDPGGEHRLVVFGAGGGADRAGDRP